MTGVWLLAVAAAAGIGALITYLLCQRSMHALRVKLSAREHELETARKTADERDRQTERSINEMSAAFAELSARALNQNNETFLRLAKENFTAHQTKATADFEKKERAVEELVKPVKEALQKTETTLSNLERDRRESAGKLEEQLRMMTSAHQSLQSETRNLVTALRRPEVRGQWGELTLRRLAELAGMVDHCDFQEQMSVDTEDGRLRPDMIIRMPEGREIVVDVKTPLDAYLSAVEAGTDAERQEHLHRHAKAMRERVRELASKRYWEQFDNAPDFVVLFIPGEQFLTAAFDVDEKLLEDALQQRVIVATPTSFVALMRAIAFGWRQLAVAENAEEIRKLGADLFGRLATFSEHLARIGKALGTGVDAYNKSVGSLERNVLPGARRFTELGVKAGKDLPDLDPIDKITREVDNA